MFSKSALLHSKTCRSKPNTLDRIQDHSVASSSWRLAPMMTHRSHLHHLGYFGHCQFCQVPVRPRIFTIELFEKKKTLQDQRLLAKRQRFLKPQGCSSWGCSEQIVTRVQFVLCNQRFNDKLAIFSHFTNRYYGFCSDFYIYWVRDGGAHGLGG